MNELKRQELKDKGIAINENMFNHHPTSLVVDEFTTFNLKLPTYFSRLLIDRFESFSSPFYPVGKQGLSDINELEGIGSYRKTVYDESLAQHLTEILLPQLPPLVYTDKLSPVQTEIDNGKQLWSLECITPLFRYMKYEKGGGHNPHYDSSFVTNSCTRTLFSGVLYLTTNEVYTRLIKDGQMCIPFKDRNTADWSNPLPSGNLVYLAKKSIEDTCFIFPHGVCHDVSENTEGNTRIIIRFDIQGTKV